MHTKTVTAVGAAAVLVGLSAGPALAAGPMVSNGGFETAPVTAQLGYEEVAPGGNGIAPWRVTSGTVDHIGSYWQPGEGRQSLDLNGSSRGAIAQDISVVPGHTYSVSFLASGNPDGPPDPKTFSVSLGGAPAQTVVMVAGATRSAMGWTPRTLGFSVPAGSATTAALVFASQDTGPYGAALDGVAVTDTTPTPVVPEAPAAALLAVAGLGALGIAVVVRRRQHA